jgi:hypothetical protein
MSKHMRQNRAVALDLDRDLHSITRTVAYYAKVEKLRGTSQQKVKTNQIQLRTFSIPLLLTTGYLVPLPYQLADCGCSRPQISLSVGTYFNSVTLTSFE